jgi:hypothetical protein
MPAFDIFGTYGWFPEYIFLVGIGFQEIRQVRIAPRKLLNISYLPKVSDLVIEILAQFGCVQLLALSDGGRFVYFWFWHWCLG